MVQLSELSSPSEKTQKKKTSKQNYLTNKGFAMDSYIPQNTQMTQFYSSRGDQTVEKQPLSLSPQLKKYDTKRSLKGKTASFYTQKDDQNRNQTISRTPLTK